MQSFDYWERKFIEEGARKMRFEAFQRQLETIKRVHGDEAYKEALLSEKPLDDLKYACIVRDPRCECFPFDVPIKLNLD